MSNTASKILGLNPAATAQTIANSEPSWVVYKSANGDYYTYPDVALKYLQPSQYSNVLMGHETVDGTLPVVPNKKMFPR